MLALIDADDAFEAATDQIPQQRNRIGGATGTLQALTGALLK